MLNCFSCVWLFATLWTVSRQAPLFMGILQARILKWVAMSSSGESSWQMHFLNKGQKMAIIVLVWREIGYYHGQANTMLYFGRMQWHPSPVLLPRKSHGWRNLVGCSPWLRVRNDWATSLSLSTFMHWRRKWQPTPVFLPGESHQRRSLVGCSPWGHTESDTTEVT